MITNPKFLILIIIGFHALAILLTLNYIKGQLNTSSLKHRLQRYKGLEKNVLTLNYPFSRIIEIREFK